MMLPFILLTIIHTTYAKSVSTEFTIQGNGKIDGGKLVVDVHLEAVNITGAVNATILPTTAPPTLAPIVTTPSNQPSTSGSPLTTAAASTTTLKPPPTTSGLNATSAPTTTGPAPNTTGATTTSAPVTTKAGPTLSTTAGPTTTLTTTQAVKKVTTLPLAQTTKAPPTTGAVKVPNPTPSAKYADKGPLAQLANQRFFSALDRTALELHNYYRSIHEAPALFLDASLQKDAQDYANKVSKSRLLRPEQDFVLASRNEGENLGFRCSVTRPDPARALRQIMKRWYDEGCNYNFQTPPEDKYSHRHFTQLTWNGSKRLGVGIAYGQVHNLQCLYFVARYSPRGNTGPALDFVNNVRKGVFDSSFCKPVAHQLTKQEVILKE